MIKFGVQKSIIALMVIIGQTGARCGLGYHPFRLVETCNEICAGWPSRGEKGVRKNLTPPHNDNIMKAINDYDMLNLYHRSRVRGLIVIKKLSGTILLLLCLSGCGIRPVATPFQLKSGPTAVLPTLAPTALPSATSTRVMDNLWTPTPVPSATALPDDVLGLVVNVVDAENVTVVLQGDHFEQAYVVRLLGVNVPPADAQNPWGIVAVEKMRAWLGGEVVRLVTDKTLLAQGRVLPRYLYLDNEFINLRLIEEGLARPEFQDPDILFEGDFSAAADRARSAQVGLWGPDPTPTPAVSPSPTLTTTIPATAGLPLTATLTPTITPPTTPTPIITVTATLTATAPITSP